MISNQMNKILFLLSIVIVNSLGNFATVRESLKLTRRNRNETAHWRWDVNWDWEEYAECKSGRICSDNEEDCKNGARWGSLWEKFRNSRKVDILDMDSNVRLVQEPAGQIDIQKYRQDKRFLSWHNCIY